MPFKSEAQRQKFTQLLKEGKITQETFDKWSEETGQVELPKKVTNTHPVIKRPRRVRK